jgi:hypothetical protein
VKAPGSAEARVEAARAAASATSAHLECTSLHSIHN